MSQPTEDHYKKLEKKPLELLNTQQINNAKSTIDKNHPLSRIPLVKALPYLHYCRCCLRKKKPDFRLALKKSLLLKMDLKMPKSDLQLEEDPFLRLGFGMGAYFDTLKLLMWAMLFIFLVVSPNIYIYQTGAGIKNDLMGVVTKYSLGNMGGSQSYCKQFPVTIDSVGLSCNTGVINTTEIAPEVGIISPSNYQFNYCMNSAANFTDSCSGIYDFNAFKSQMTTNCNGQKNCSIANPAQYFTTGASLDPNYGICNTVQALFFVQVGCSVPDEEMNNRQIAGLYIGCIAVFVALFFVCFVDYISSVFKNSFIEWDVKTITAGDYSCELPIPAAMWNKFLAENYHPGEPKTKIAQFRDYLQTHLEERLTKLPDLGYEDVPPPRINISMITFAFDNAQLINLLRVRGAHIKFERYEKMREWNKKIDELKSNPEKLKALNRPVTAFLTFENEEGINRAKGYAEAVQDPEFENIRTFLGETLDFIDASEPTDIIWENRHFTGFDRFKRTLIVVGVVFFLLFISFIVIFFCSAQASKPVLKYPQSNAICGALKEDFTDDQMQGLAYRDYYFNEVIGADNTQKAYSSYLPCFCNDQKLDKVAASFEYPNPLNTTQTLPICAQYQNEKFAGLIFGSFMSFIIVAINSILRIIMITLIKWIGEDTHSSQLKSITNGVFVAQFFNTAILLILSNANFAEVGLPLASIFNGPFYDFTPRWYTAVGYRLTQTMLINSIFPYIEFGIAYSQRFVFRRMDRSWGSDTYKTKKTSMQLYVDLYSGPEYFIHFKYSGILNVSFVTMMYGVGLPILFPIAAFTYFNLYTIERLLVAYFVQLPPTFDDKMTKNAVSILRWAAILHLFFGYWMLSSKQIFQNLYSFIPNSQTPMLTQHTFANIKVDQAVPIALMGGCVLVIVLLQTFFKKTMKKWGFSFGGSKINVDENLPYFFTAIKLSDADWLIKENQNLKDNYGFEIISDHVSETLDTVGPPKKAIQGVPYYIILSNPSYFRDFYYICCDVPDRNTLIKDDDEDEGNDSEQSDIVSLMLNLAFIPEYVAEKFTFKTGFSKDFKPAMDQYKIGQSVLKKIGGAGILKQ